MAPRTRVLVDLNVGSITPCEQHWEGSGNVLETQQEAHECLGSWDK